MRHLILSLICCSLLTAIQSNAQETRRAIILINGVAHVADLSTNGSVIAFYQSIPNYFSNNLSDEAIIAQVETGGLDSEGTVEVYTEETLTPVLSEFERVREYSTDQKQYVSFSQGRAILNREAVDQIRLLADNYQNKSISEIIINAYHDDTPRQRLLSQNRSKAINDLLVTFGVSSGAIQRNLPYGNQGDQLYFVYIRTVE